jgi:hypothetical protein
MPWGPLVDFQTPLIGGGVPPPPGLTGVGLSSPQLVIHRIEIAAMTIKTRFMISPFLPKSRQRGIRLHGGLTGGLYFPRDLRLNDALASF